MQEAQKCPQCDAPLPSDGWEGLCPRCLVRFSLKTAGPTSERGMQTSESTTAACDPTVPASQGRDSEQQPGGAGQGWARHLVVTTTHGGKTSFVHSALP